MKMILLTASINQTMCDIEKKFLTRSIRRELESMKKSPEDVYKGTTLKEMLDITRKEEGLIERIMGGVDRIYESCQSVPFGHQRDRMMKRMVRSVWKSLYPEDIPKKFTYQLMVLSIERHIDIAIQIILNDCEPHMAMILADVADMVTSSHLLGVRNIVHSVQPDEIESLYDVLDEGIEIVKNSMDQFEYNEEAVIFAWNLIMGHVDNSIDLIDICAIDNWEDSGVTEASTPDFLTIDIPTQTSGIPDVIDENDIWPVTGGNGGNWGNW